MTIDLVGKSTSLSETQKSGVREMVDRIVTQKSQTVYECVASIRDKIISTDVTTREAAINELSATVLLLPRDILTPAVANFLLEFLLPRVEDSGHVAAEFLVAVVMHLVLCCGKDLSHEIIATTIKILYETNGVQSYAQRDRMTLFELLLYLLTHFQQEICIFYDASRLIVAFMRAANSERDPRCLLKIFEIFNFIARHFPLGDLAEDMFELIACYYPIDYEPRESDVGKITSAMLSTACESCLTANLAFGPFCFQLVADKLLDWDAPPPTDDGSDDSKLRLRQQLDVCRFLCKACATFASPTIIEPAASHFAQPPNFVQRTGLEDFMTGFRLIALNPVTQSSKETVAEVRRRLADAANALTNYMTRVEKSPEELEKDLKFMATNSLENCEPFVLQAEMGLTGQALLVLESLATASRTAAVLIVPRVLYWFNVLLTGMTLKSPTNRQEVCEECLEFLTVWFQMAVELYSDGFLPFDVMSKHLDDVFDAVDGVKAFCLAGKVLRFRCECIRLVADASYTLIPNRRLTALAEEIVSMACNGQQITSSSDATANDTTAALSAAVRFVSHVAVADPEKCRRLVEEPLLAGQDADWSVASRLLSAAIHDGPSAERIVPELFRRVVDNQNLFAVLQLSVLDAAERLASCSDEAYKTFERELFAFLTTNFRESNRLNTIAVELSKFLQHLGSTLSEARHNQLVTFLLDIEGRKIDDTSCCVIAPLIQQSKSLMLVERFVDFVGLSAHDETIVRCIFVDLLFALCLRAKSFNRPADVHLLVGRTLQRICQCVDAMETIDPTVWLTDNFFGWSACQCGGLLAARVAMNRAYLLADSWLGIRFTSALFEHLISAAGQSVDSLEKLLDFSSAHVDPKRCNLTNDCTPLWQQRVFCQFVPIYVDYFGRIDKAIVSTQASFLRVLPPLFRLAQTVGRSMRDQLKMLAPVVTQAFRLIAHAREDAPVSLVIDKRLILDATVELLRAVHNVDELANGSVSDDSPLGLFLTVYTGEILRNKQMDIVYGCLNGLKLLAQKSSRSSNAVDLLRMHYPLVVQGTTRMAQSTSRTIRQRSADVRNIWEML